MQAIGDLLFAIRANFDILLVILGVALLLVSVIRKATTKDKGTFLTRDSGLLTGVFVVGAILTRVGLGYIYLWNVRA